MCIYFLYYLNLLDKDVCYIIYYFVLFFFNIKYVINLLFIMFNENCGFFILFKNLLLIFFW